ncbi:MAG TPA: YggT family protein [Dehalococcoidia bacterium]|nr:YggT family protein [Dehalococcoidia bacterium]
MLVDIVQATILVLTFLIIARALLSWFPNLDPSNPAVEFLITVTEPILAPIRAVMPRLGFLDLTPMVAIILLQVIGRVLVNALA